MQTKRIQEPKSEAASRARDLVQTNPYFSTRASQFDFELAGDVLVVRGRLPSFHLKQMLQSLLGKVEGVARVDNRVHVVSCAGFSSARK
jgi:hypothetical protein